MAVQVKIPSLGESVTEAILGTWLAEEGQAIAVDEVIFSSFRLFVFLSSSLSLSSSSEYLFNAVSSICVVNSSVKISS